PSLASSAMPLEFPCAGERSGLGDAHWRAIAQRGELALDRVKAGGDVLLTDVTEVADADDLALQAFLAARDHRRLALAQRLGERLRLNTLRHTERCHRAGGVRWLGEGFQTQGARPAAGQLRHARVTGEDRLAPLRAHQLQRDLQPEIDADRWSVGRLALV